MQSVRILSNTLSFNVLEFSGEFKKSWEVFHLKCSKKKLFFIIVGIIISVVIAFLLINNSFIGENIRWRREQVKRINSIATLLNEHNIAQDLIVVYVEKNERGLYNKIILNTESRIDDTKIVQSMIELADFIEKPENKKLFTQDRVEVGFNDAHHYAQSEASVPIPPFPTIEINLSKNHCKLEAGVEFDKLDLKGINELSFILRGNKLSYSEAVTEISIRVVENGDINSLTNFPNLKEINFKSISDNENFFNSLINITNSIKPLKKITFSRGIISNEELKILRKALPYCEIYEVDHNGNKT